VTGVDLVILAGLAFFLVRGLLNGFVGELAPLAGLAAGLAAGAAFGDDAARWAAREWGWAAGLAPGLLAILGYAACFVAGYAGCRLAATLLGGAGRPGAAPGGVARVGGALLGLAKGTLLVGFALLGCSWVLSDAAAHRLLQTSPLARELTRLSGSLLAWANTWL
jgi:uncharacterized membrane protein required for colicin V production